MRSLHVLVATALLTLSIGSAACSGAPADDGSQSSESSVVSSNKVKLTQADDGTTVKVNVGQDVVLTLPENGSTGYTWMITSNDLGDPQREIVGGNPSQPGAGGHVKLTWSTAGAGGLHTIALVLQRPWAETSPPAAHFSVTLDIEEPGKPGLTCATVDCAPGNHCEMKGINGGAIPVCVEDQQPADCRSNGCDDGKWCSMCWGTFACIPKGAMC